MNTFQLSKKIKSQLNQLSPERLDLVSHFIDSIQTTETVDSLTLHKLSPIKRGRNAKDLLRHAATWQGDDLENCLNIVREARSESHF
jgi:hypothetical protein